MERILEPELMDDPVQAQAYAEADFEEPNAHFVSLFRDFVEDTDFSGSILDLGCGPGDISIRLAKSFPGCEVHAVDGSKPMLDFAKKAVLTESGIDRRVTFIQGLIEELKLPYSSYNAVVSNSLLHHLANPQALWSTLKTFTGGGAAILIMDLIRPHSTVIASALVETYASQEASILKRDFYNSLCAAFTPEEIQSQLQDAGLSHLQVTRVSDRHMTISGFLLAKGDFS